MTVEKLLSYPLPAQITPQQLAVFDGVVTLPLTSQTRSRNHSGGSTGSYGSTGSSSGYGSERLGPAATAAAATALSPELVYHLSKMQNGMVRIAQQQQQQQQQQLHTSQQQQQQQQQQQSRQKRTDRPVASSPPDRSAQGGGGGGVHKNINPTRYKTEMCRPFEESGYCKYGEKCQFAHGCHELRTLSRHPKYKTELCRTYHTVGFCPYGPRCHFIHNEDDVKLSEITQMKQQQALKQVAEQVVAAQQQQQQQQVLSQIGSQVHKPEQLTGSTTSSTLVSHQTAAAAAAAAAVAAVAPVSRPKTLDFCSNSNSSSCGGPLPLPLSLGSTIDTPPSSVTNSPPSLSPTSMMSDDVMSGLPTPPPGFTAPPALSNVFSFPDLAAKPIPASSGSCSGSPLSVNVANLAAGLQAATINGTHCRHDDVITDCLGEIFAAASAPLTPPTTTTHHYGGDDQQMAALDAHRPLHHGSSNSSNNNNHGLLRLPIFSQLAVGIN